MDPKANWIEAITYCPPILLFVGVILCIGYYSKLESVHRVLFLYMAAALLIDVLSRVLAELFNNNLILIPIFGLIELILLTYLYFKYLISIKNRYWLIPIAFLLVFNVVEIFTLINVEPKDFHCSSRVLDSLAIVIMSIVFFIKAIGSDIQLKPGFLFLNTAIFAFHSLNLVLYLPINYLINVESLIKFHFWTASVILTSIFYISIIRIIWIHGKNLKH